MTNPIAGKDGAKIRLMLSPGPISEFSGFATRTRLLGLARWQVWTEKREERIVHW